MMTTSPASNMDVKRRNRVNTFRRILENDRISQMELSKRLDLSWPTILQNVKELTELGLVREDGMYASTGGRKAKAYAPVRDARLAVGVDLTRDHVSVVLTDLSGKLLRQARGALRFSMEDIYFKYLGGLLQRFVDASGAEDRLLGVGIETCRSTALPSRFLGIAASLTMPTPPDWRKPTAGKGILSIFPWATPWVGRSFGTAGFIWETISGRENLDIRL